MHINFIAVLIAALIPMLIGFIWYNPKVFGKAWMAASGITEEQMKSGNMAVIFGVSFLFSLLLAVQTNFLVIHQFHYFSILMNEPGLDDANSEMGRMAADFMAKYGHNFRTFKHGAFHGAIAGIFFALPVMGISSLFERRSFKYIFIHTGYWVVTLALMGGVICGMV
ncbi:MAG: DUF1761 domain-containing protein [Bacteroidota bacterium]